MELLSNKTSIKFNSSKYQDLANIGYFNFLEDPNKNLINPNSDECKRGLELF
jgi:hypothetical protein